MQTLSCILLLLCGVYFTVRLRAFPYLHPLRTAKVATAGEGRFSSFRALTVALAGTLGVGNITGVMFALAAGGAGAIVWMWISGLLAALIRYAEVVMALGCREGDDHYPQTPFGRARSLLFSVLCAAVGLSMGAALQSGAAAESASLAIGVPRALTGVLFFFLVGAVILGGIRSVGKVTVFLIPLVSLVYLILTGGVILRYADRIPSVLSAMVRDAFSGRAAGSGIFGYLVTEKMTIGVRRGLLSNEAGCGTAPIAHGTAGEVSPVRQGVYGIFEVFADTLFVSSLSALAVLLPSSGAPPTALGILPLLSEIGAVFGGAGRVLLVLCLFCFAYATALAWSHYGTASVRRLFPGRRAETVYLVLFSIALFGGTVLPLGAILSATDLLLSVMTLINLSVLMQKADRVCTLSAKEGLISPPRAHTREYGREADRRNS